MKNVTTAATVAAMILFTAGQSHALVVCAKDDGTGQPKERSKLVLKTACTAGKEVPIGIAVTGTVGVNARVEVYQADLGVSAGNLQVTSGSGATDGAVNGKGNLIVGYNEATGGQTRTGSHNIVVGKEHEFTSFGGLVAGLSNTISGEYSSVTGGELNVASGLLASVSGGGVNTVSGIVASVSGGSHNKASGVYASVCGGNNNEASGGYSSVSGGQSNTADGTCSSVSGGHSNGAFAIHTSVSGGELNTAGGNVASVSGGFSNTANGTYSSVSGGNTLTSSAPGEWHAGQSAGFPTGTQY